MSDQVLQIRVEQRVAVLTLNRPEARNALDDALVERLGSSIEQLGADRSVGCLVLTGAGGAFCSGADLKARLADPNIMNRLDELLDSFHRIIRAVVAAPQPVIAAVDGPPWASAAI